MKVLVVGNGGREHALAWRLSTAPGVQVVITQGNGGTDAVARPLPVQVPDLDAVVKAAQAEKVDLVAIGPESPLAAGLVDRLRAAGLRAFGPVQAAARIEASKAFAHEVMEAAGVPCARSEVFDDPKAAMRYLATCPVPVVIKADGLAAGKGVVVATTREEAIEAAKEFMVDGALGAAGRRLLIEEHLVGREASFMVMTDGEYVLPLAPAQDHKRLRDGDRGPNTGGMGAFSPTRVLPSAAQKDVVDRVVRPTLAELARRGIRYQGVLYAGLMMTKGGPRVLEFNCRFGDPETQPVLARLRGDLARAMVATTDGTLHKVRLTFDPRPAVCVVLASEGYPERPRTGDPIAGVAEAEQFDGVRVFHAATRRRPDGALVTSGGRILGVTAVGDSLTAARDLAYRAAARIRFAGMQFRRDIGPRGAARRKQGGDRRPT